MRHQQYILFYSGIAILAFGLWAAVKLVLNLTVHPFPWNDAKGLAQYTDNDKLLIALLTYGIIALFLMLTLLNRAYICRCAMQEAVGKKSHYLYLLLTIFLFLINFLSAYSAMLKYMTGDYSSNQYLISEQGITTTFIEFTGELSLVLTVISAIRLKWLRRKLKQQEQT